jgi:hypothetical protein
MIELDFTTLLSSLTAWKEPLVHKPERLNAKQLLDDEGGNGAPEESQATSRLRAFLRPWYHCPNEIPQAANRVVRGVGRGDVLVVGAVGAELLAGRLYHSSWTEQIDRRGIQRRQVGSLSGLRPLWPVEFEWSFESERSDRYVSTRATFYAWSNPNNAVVVPHWFGILPLAGLTALPWLPWRFSLRTLLIATTLVAILLGLIVYYPKSYRWWPEKDQKFWRSPQ